MQKFSLLAATVLLSGCQTVNSTWSSVTSPDTSQTSRPAKSQTTVPSAPQTAMVAPRGTPNSLKGQTAEALQLLWGEPSLKRKDLGSELWQYAGKGCTLLVYLYPASGGMLTVNHAEAVPGGADDAAIDACAKAAGKASIKPVS